MTDPLSFFAGEDSSDSESEGGAEPDSTSEKVEEVPRADKLPSPDTLFATVGRPSFLSSIDPSDREVNWDRFVKDDTEEDIHSDDTHAAIPPPSDLDSTRRNVSSSLSIAIASTYTTPSHEISAAPVKYSRPKKDNDDDDNDEHSSEGRAQDAKLSSSAVAGTKRAVDSSAAAAAKRAKMETFRQKEKRKRDTGQTSRGKSYVEEEKRILRQAFSTDEVMS